MSGASATHLILFVASLVVAAGIAGTVIVEVNQLSDAIETRGTGVADEIQTEIAIISDEKQSDAIYNDSENELTVLVKNIGSETVPVDAQIVDTLIDGRYVSNDEVTVERVDVSGSDSWRPGGVIEVTIANQSVSGDTEIAVIVNGNEDSIDVHV
ncbi:flagellin [Halopiger djelfimassiliensis]|uniref:flagellin n=1 Tax=Halopiger djelfimassiliensis TaxID=1293047 RepID=UPI000677F27B|nr:flagellin [Halopiger djelfimassiliensis]